MIVYIVRHAWAGESGDPKYPDDTQRPLTSEGKKRFRKVVKQLSKRDVAPQRVATSPLVRCRQTAEILVDVLPEVPSLTVVDAMAPGAHWDDVLPWVQHQEGVDEVALV